MHPPPPEIEPLEHFEELPTQLYHKQTPWYKHKIHNTVKVFPLFLGVSLFILFLVIPIINKPSAHRCLAILVLIAILWGTEAIPVVATAMLIPLPVVILGVLNDENGKQLDSVDAAAQISWQFFDPVVILFLGGFTIAKALEKYGLSQTLAHWTLDKAGDSPSKILFAIMFLGMFLSMWISNVAASVLCVSAVIPIIKNQLHRDDPYAKSLLLGIAFSCNIGGMTTPIASPQNAIALHSMLDVKDPKTGKLVSEHISFVEWMAVSIPFCLVLLIISWKFLMLMYPPHIKSVKSTKSAMVELTDTHVDETESLLGTETQKSDDFGTFTTGFGESLINSISASTPIHTDLDSSSNSKVVENSSTDLNEEAEIFDKDPNTFTSPFIWTSQRIYVVFVVFLTVLLWCTEPLHIQYTGSIGIIAVIPVVLFFGSGILTTQEFDSLTWSVLILMGGGLAIGHAIQMSDLLHIVADTLGQIVSHDNIWVILLAFSFMMGVIANFISSTVAAVIILPVMAVIGLSHNHMRMLVINSALMCSGAMALPVSSFPNANSFSVVDSNSIPFAPTFHYIKAGLPMTFFSVGCVLTIGFGICSVLGY